MLLRAIAIDYDGTIAENNVLNEHVREAIVEARSSGLFVVIVTGRILRELRRVAGDLGFVDGVVAENGGVILLTNGHRRLLGPPPFPLLMQELSDRGIEFIVGRCLLDMDAEYAGTVLSVIKQKGLPLMIVFNKNRMMVLPRMISKSSGLREMLDILGTSIHNTVGIGDAENDYELLKDCEYGVTVEWAPDFLKSEADFIIEGDSQDSVADYIRTVSSHNRIPTRGMSHRNLVLESTAGQASFEIANRGRNILIAGDSKSGKSWIAGLFCEQLIQQRYTVIVIDPEGDYSSLTTLPNTLVVGAGNPLPEFRDMLSLFRQGLSLIINFSQMGFAEKKSYIRELLPLAAKYRRDRGYPHAILIDECHYFLTDEIEGCLLDPELGSYILVTYQPSLLPEKVMQKVEVLVATRITEAEEVDAISGHRDPDLSDDWYDTLANLKTTEAVLLPPTVEAGGKPVRFSVVPRLTRHIRHRSKYFENRLRDDQAFVFTRHGAAVGEPVYALHELAERVKNMEPDVTSGHLGRHDFSHWIFAIFGDHDLAMKIERLERAHIRSHDLSGFADQLAGAIEEQYRQGDV